MDEVTASYGDNTVAWYQNDGHQNFTQRVVSNSVNGATDAFPADVDGDGDCALFRLLSR